MISFLQPIWLWAAAGIIIPIAIHLWNVKQGKTLKVGSIAFITESARSQARNFKISQWLLLLLRCLLIVVLAMLLAKPYFNRQLNAKEEGWIVIERSGLKNAYHTYQPTIDSLRKQGYFLHYFNETFQDIDWNDTLKTEESTATNIVRSYWALLKALDEKVPANLPVYLFTDKRLQHFSGNRPEVSLNIKWFTYLSTDTAVTWIANAYKATDDSIRIIAGKTSALGTYYTHQNLSFNEVNDKFRVERNNGKTFVVTNDSLYQTIAVDTSTLSITIYTNKYFADANYLRAALDAIKDFTQRNMQVTVVHNIKDIPGNAGWLFWLSDEAVPASKLKGKVFMYENGKSENVHSTLLTDDNTPLTNIEPVTLFQYIKNDNTSFQPIWKNGFDEPILNMQKNGATVYHFYSHFNPQWNDLVWSHAFPQIIYNLLFREEDVANEMTNAKDRRIIDSSQIQPVMLTAKKVNNKEVQQNRKDIPQVFWFIAFLLLLLERIASFKQTKVVYE